MQILSNSGFFQISQSKIHVQLRSCMGWTTIIFGSFTAVSIGFSLLSFHCMTLVSVEQMNSSFWQILELDSFVGSHLYCFWLFLSSSLIVFSGTETSNTLNELVGVATTVSSIFCSFIDEFLPSSAECSSAR